MSEIMENQNQEMLQQLSEQEAIRREKLQKLVEAGNDPYTITRYDRTHTSQQILDRYGLVQRVCEGNHRTYKDVLIYQKGYKLTKLDKDFITALCAARRKFIKR